MARIRTIKPEFWTSEQIAECSTNARLLFIGTWNFSDDQGVHPASLKRLKMEVFPADEFTIPEIGAMVDELVRAGLLQIFEVDGKRFWNVTGWHHQKIDRPNPRYPSPSSGRVIPPEAADSRREFDESSTNDQRDLDDHSPPEGKGREGKGRESKGREGKVRDLKPPLPPKGEFVGDVLQVFDHYRTYHLRSHPKPSSESKEWKAITARLKEGHSADDLKTAIDGCHKSPYHCGENEAGRKYQSLELIVRDSSKVAQFIEANGEAGAPVLSEKTRRNNRAAQSYLARKGFGNELE